MKVLGVSGSPIYNSNTDRALKVALEATGLETEFIKLVEYRTLRAGHVSVVWIRISV